MKSFLSLIALLLLPFLLFAQERERVTVPGTRCTIIPPAYFLPSSAFMGFVGEEAGASILVTDNPVSAFEMADSFANGIQRKSNGMKLKKRDTVIIEGQAFSLLVYSQTTEEKTYEKQILFLGDQENVLMIMATYPEVNSGLAPILRESLLTSRFNKSMTANPEAAAPFAVDAASQNFIPRKYRSGVLTYTARERLYGSNGIYVVSMLEGQLNVEEKEKYLEQQLQKMGDKEIEVLSLKPITIQYLNGYELLGRRREKSGTSLLHLTVLFQDDAGLIYTLTGIASSRPKYWNKRFEALAQSFRLK